MGGCVEASALVDCVHTSYNSSTLEIDISKTNEFNGRWLLQPAVYQPNCIHSKIFIFENLLKLKPVNTDALKSAKMQSKSVEQQVIGISIIEDDEVVRRNIEKYISYCQDFEVISSHGSVESFLRSPGRNSDVMILDIGLPGKSGLDGIPDILEELPDLDIVMLTTYEEEDMVLRAICQGAVGYLSKKTSLEDLMEAMRIVHAGGSYMSPMIAREIFRKFAQPPAKEVESSLLTQKQMNVLKRLVDGQTYTAIADDLAVSRETVKSHIKKIYRALHVKNKSQAIRKYLEGDLN